MSLASNGNNPLSFTGANDTLSYEISTSLTMRQISYDSFASYRAANPSIQPSTSALGILRFLGGVAQTALNNRAINLYAQNSQLFEQYLYVTTYAEIITDAAAQAATVQAVSDIITAYAINYRNQSDFNYISYFYLINDQLTAAQATLITQYPGSTDQINEFFRYLENRVTTLLA